MVIRNPAAERPLWIIYPESKHWAGGSSNVEQEFMQRKKKIPEIYITRFAVPLLSICVAILIVIFEVWRL